MEKYMAFSMIISVKSLSEDDFTTLYQELIILLKVKNLEEISSIQKINTMDLSPILTKIESESYWLTLMKNLTVYHTIVIIYSGNVRDSEFLKFKKKNKRVLYENEYFNTRTPRLLNLLQEIVDKKRWLYQY